MANEAYGGYTIRLPKLSTNSLSSPAIGGAASVDISFALNPEDKRVQGISVIPVSNVSWITVAVPANIQNGMGTITFTVAPNNTSVQRTGTINIGGQIFTVTQEAGRDTIPPTITAPANLSVNAANNQCATNVNPGSPTVDDNLPGVTFTAARSDNKILTEPFAVGITTIIWTAVDVAGNTATATQTVTVLDKQAPGLTAPAAVTVATTATATSCSVFVSDTALGKATALDNCSAVTLTHSGVLTGNLFPIGTTTVTYTAKDAAGNIATATQTITVQDKTAPIISCPTNITAVSNILGACGATVNLGTATATDNCSTSVAITNNAPAIFPLGATLITWKATDSAGNQSTCQQTVTVTNPAPVVTLTSPATGATYAVGTTVNLAGNFTDNAGGTHTAMWSFDNLTKVGVVNEATGAVTGSYTFTAAGVYKVTLTVVDGCGGTGTATAIDGLDLLLVVYDPNGGWVTGGGWINSLAGAYVTNPALTGKANFGFVSKYQTGATIPTGNTEFQFKAGNLNFSSTAYDWLVIAGARAQYKGAGTINGTGDYRFMLTAIDGQEPGGGGQDKFRIRIWNYAGGGLVYDNQMNAPDNADPTTILGGGQIVIHK